MCYDFNILEGRGVQILKHQILIHISSFAIAEWLTTCGYSSFWQNEQKDFTFYEAVVTGWNQAGSTGEPSPGSTSFMMYCVSNYFRSNYLSFCLLWVNACKYATIWNIKSPSINVKKRRQWEMYSLRVAYLKMNFQNSFLRSKI